MPRVNVRLDDDLYARLAQAANGRGHPISRWVRNALASALPDKEESGVAAAEERIAATLDPSSTVCEIESLEPVDLFGGGRANRAKRSVTKLQS
jgi:predicted transcriptional regulator